MLNECLSDKGTAKLYIQVFRFKKKTDLNILVQDDIRDFEAIQNICSRV